MEEALVKSAEGVSTWSVRFFDDCCWSCRSGWEQVDAGGGLGLINRVVGGVNDSCGLWLWTRGLMWSYSWHRQSISSPGSSQVPLQLRARLANHDVLLLCGVRSLSNFIITFLVEAMLNEHYNVAVWEGGQSPARVADFRWNVQASSQLLQYSVCVCAGER